MCCSPVLYRVYVEVDKPDEGVLVHGVNVGEISNTKEEDGRMLGDLSVALSGLCYLEFCFLCNLNL